MEYLTYQGMTNFITVLKSVCETLNLLGVVLDKENVWRDENTSRKYLKSQQNRL